MSDLQSEFFQALSANDEGFMRAFLARTKSSPVEYRNQKGCTGLHLLTLLPTLKMLYCLLEEIRRISQGHSAEVLRSWVNVKNSDGLTALHYAFYNGKIDCARIFLQLGASVAERSNSGGNVLWYAAQADQALMVAYSRELQVPLESADNSGDTALHCAAREKAEFVANVLLALDLNGNIIDSQNHLGQTPLMVATLNGSRRIVRNLLLRGKTALDHARASNNPVIADMISESWAVVLLGDQPMRPIRCKALPVLAVLALLLVGNGFLDWKVHAHFGMLWVWVCRGLVALVLLFFFLLMCINPGFVEPGASPIKLRVPPTQILYEHNNMQDVCPDCVLLRSRRSHHCYYCRLCVQKFDHHCPWVANCVGRRNLWAFYIFLLLVAVDIAVICAVAVYSLVKDLVDKQSPFDFVACCAVASGGLIIFLPVFALLVVQMSNLVKNTTTHEKYSATPALQSGSCLRNCLDMCCDVQARVCEPEDIHSKSAKDSDDLVRPLL